MKKVLMTASVPSMIGQFNMNNIQILQELGFEVHVACNWKDTSVWTIDKINELKEILTKISVKIYQVSFSRHPLNLYEHIHSHNQLLEIVNKHQYKFIHCHTPIAGAISRIICKKSNTRCIYTAHGFHFFKGAPLRNWIIFYPIEKWLSKYTDILITINLEDYERAKVNFKMKKLKYVPGVGIDMDKFKLKDFDKESYRKKLKLKEKDFAILSVGELNKNKNHEIVIRAIAKLDNKNIHYFIAGEGNLRQYLVSLSEALNISNQVHLLGFRNDIPELNNSVDVYILPSIREGLNVSLMEAMASGLPTIVSDIRGNKDLITENINGLLFNPNDYHKLTENLKTLSGNKKVQNIMKNNNKEKIKDYSSLVINKIMYDIYNNISLEKGTLIKN